jgi:bacterioferritin
MKPLQLDIDQIREHARSSIEDGAVTVGYRADREGVVKVLNDALATELVCVLRYRFHYYMASGLAAESVRTEFLEHANEEQQHADWLAERITQLNGKPEMDPVKIARNSHTQYVEADGINGMLTEDLVAERIAIETYTAILDWLGDDDPTTSRLLRKILEKEEEHAEDLATLLDRGK